MHNDFIDLIGNLEFALTLSAVVFSVLGGILAMLASRRRRAAPLEESGGTKIPPDVAPTEGLEFAARLSEFREIVRHQQRTAQLNSLAYNVLMFGQYVVGATLTTAFVQQNIGDYTIGALGVVVLISSIVQQHFRPDSVAVQAKSQAIRASMACRMLEDLVFSALTNSENAKKPHEMRAIATAAMAELEDQELANVELRYAEREKVRVGTETG